MIGRTMYIWKLAPVLSAEGGTAKVVEKAKRAKLSAIWIKMADGKSPYSNVTGGTAQKFRDLVSRCHSKNIQIWGWHVPHCLTSYIAKSEADTVSQLTSEFELDGIIMDAEGGGTFFQGGKDEAIAYATAMRAVADHLHKPLAISSNDIPQNIDGWLPKFNKIAFVADYNFPQVYYGGSPSVDSRLSRAENGNAHVTIPFVPVGAGWIGSGGGCSSASACAERALIFINLINSRGYQGYSFWHWAGAPMALWDVLNSTLVNFPSDAPSA
jgi:hypothetical protein